MMKVELNPRLEKLVQAKIDAGIYADAAEVVEDALALLEEHYLRAAQLCGAVSQARRQVSEGRYTIVEDEAELTALFNDQ